jgi:hypothetical protein
MTKCVINSCIIIHCSGWNYYSTLRTATADAADVIVTSQKEHVGDVVASKTEIITLEGNQSETEIGSSKADQSETQMETQEADHSNEVQSGDVATSGLDSKSTDAR